MRYEETARRFSYAMANAQITQQELADKAHIGKSSISHYVNGSNEPGHKAAYALAKVLNVNPLWLMGLDVPMDPPALFASDNLELTDIEVRIIEAYRRCSPELKAALHGFLGLKGEAHASETAEHSIV